MPVFLPRRFCWRPLWAGMVRLDAYGLFDGDTEVARVRARINNDGWWASINRHLERDRQRGARYNRMDKAFRAVESWAAANSRLLPGGDDFSVAR